MFALFENYISFIFIYVFIALLFLFLFCKNEERNTFHFPSSLQETGNVSFIYFCYTEWMVIWNNL